MPPSLNGKHQDGWNNQNHMKNTPPFSSVFQVLKLVGTSSKSLSKMISPDVKANL